MLQVQQIGGEIAVRPLKNAIFNHTRELYDWLNVDELLPLLQNTQYQFLSNDQLAKLESDRLTRREKARTLIAQIRQLDFEATFRHFLACLLLETNHSGHRDIYDVIRAELPLVEVLKIEDIASAGGDRCFSAKISKSPGKIILTGPLKGKGYDKIDEHLWRFFSTGNYDSLSELSKKLQSREGCPDYQILGLWFDSLISMHRDGDFHKCVSDLLIPALEKCNDDRTRNPTILRGRILQRMAQIYLVEGRVKEAETRFEEAQGCLQLVGRGYDIANTFCRRAKLLSATEFSDRKKVEEEYEKALSCVRPDDSFALASRPSLLLSKAAFHLHISFGKKPHSCSDGEPYVMEEEVGKAKATLSALADEDVLLDMRKCELLVLRAEILKREGSQDEAVVLFDQALVASRKANLANLVAIAKDRLHSIELEREEEAWSKDVLGEM